MSDWAAVAIAVVGAVQIIALAYIAAKTNRIGHQTDGMLSRLEETQATDVELEARSPAPPIIGTTSRRQR